MADAEDIQPVTQYEFQRLTRLRTMKTIPLLLLAVMAVVFWLTLRVEVTWIGYVHAFAEAAMIGALADWFAVTALFRHPFGVPIPHTAIIPKRKDAIGGALGRFVAEHFLTAEAIRRRLENTSLAALLAEWLGRPQVRREMTGLITGFAAWLAGSVASEQVRGFAQRLGERHLSGVNPAPIAGRVLSFMVRDGRHQWVFTQLLRHVLALLHENRDEIRKRIAEGSPWWMPGFMDDRIVVQMIERIETLLMEMTLDPDHELRERFDARVERLADQLEHDPEFRVLGERIKRELLNNPDLADYVEGLWGDLHVMLTEAAEDLDSPIRASLDRILYGTGRELAADPAMQAQVDAWLEQALIAVVAEHRYQLAGLISETVATWDGVDTARRVELEIGQDLQFIRINGTLVGGLIGVLLHGLVQVLGGR